jgi:hypothetical protein
VRQHEHAVRGGFADGPEELRRLLDGGGGVEVRFQARDDAFESLEIGGRPDSR